MDLEHFTDLDDELAVGSYPHTPDHVHFLRDQIGVTAVLNLQSDVDLKMRGVDWTVMWPLYTRLGVQTSRVPILDFTPTDLAKHLDKAVEALDKFVSKGRKVYVHCNAGLNRSPSVVIAYLAAARSLDLAAATAWLEERHDCVPYPDVLKAWAKRQGHLLEG